MIPVQQIIWWGQELIHQKMVGKNGFFCPTNWHLCRRRDIFLTDTGVAALKIVSPTEALADFLKHNPMLYTSHEIHSNQPPDLLTVIPIMEEVVFYFEEAITAARARVGGRTSVEGPHGVPSSKTISGTRMTLEALKRIQSEIEAVHRDYVSKVNVKALVTLLIQHFNSKMRPVYDMPTVQLFCYQFSAAVEETLKRISNYTRIMTFPMGWLSLKRFQKFRAL